MLSQSTITTVNPDTNPGPVDDDSYRLTSEHLRLLAQQTSLVWFIDISILLGLGVLYYEHLNVELLSGLTAIISVYIARFWLGKKYLEHQQQDPRQQTHTLVWLHILATLSGIAWGFTISMFILLVEPQTHHFIFFFLAFITAGVIPSLGVMPVAYLCYILGVLLPVSFTFISMNTESSYTFALLLIPYGMYLFSAARNFQKRLDSWHQRSIVNEKFTNNLIEEKRQSDQTIINMESDCQKCKKGKAASKHHQLSLSNSLGHLPGMKYRAVNDGNWTLEYISADCKDIIGLSVDELKSEGKNKLSDILVRIDNNHRENLTALNNDDGYSYQYEYSLLTPQGLERRVLEFGHRIYDDMGMLKAIEGIVTDISEIKNILGDDITHEYDGDYLTDIANRAQFQAIIEDTLRTKADEHFTHSLIYVNLDQFNNINKSSGYIAGDNVISQTSSLLQRRFCSKDKFVARIGGDEFGILLEGCDTGEASRIANELCRSIEQFNFRFKNQDLKLTASIGVATTSAVVSSFQKLLLNADMAVQAAKTEGGNRVHVAPQLDDTQRQQDRGQVEDKTKINDDIQA